MNYIQSPTIKGNYEKKDLREYAKYRKENEIKTIQSILNDQKIREGDICPEEHEEYTEPLAVSKEIVIEITLSTGGDADGFKLTFNQDNELIKGVYYWADWGVYEEVRLSDEELELVDNLYYVSEWIMT